MLEQNRTGFAFQSTLPVDGLKDCYIMSYIMKGLYKIVRNLNSIGNVFVDKNMKEGSVYYMLPLTKLKREVTKCISNIVSINGISSHGSQCG